MAISPYIAAATAVLGMAGTKADLEAENKTLMNNMGNNADSLEFSQGQKMQQANDLDRILGDKLTSSGLEAMKTEARLKAASAETGGTGTSNNEAIQTAEINKLHNNAALIRSHDTQKANTYSSMVAERLSFENMNDSMLSGQTSAESAGLQTASSGLKGMALGMSFMDAGAKEEFYGTNTTGA